MQRGDSQALVRCTLAMAFSLGLPATTGAQEADRTAIRVLMHGVVYDELTRTPIPGAAVYLEVSPRVYVDEIPAIRGLDELESYPPSQIYQIEVFSYGAEIRAYTYGFMQRMAEKPRALMPIGWQ